MVTVSLHLLLCFFSATCSVSLGGQSPAPLTPDPLTPDPLTPAPLTPAPLTPAPHCPPRWLLFGQRCFAFFPVWSSWSTARTSCSLSGGSLVSLHTPEEKQIVLRLTESSIPVWLGRHQNGSWLWRDDALPKNWTNQMDDKTKGGHTCLQMMPKSGELHHTPCGELLFYVCTTSPRFTSTSLNSHKLLQPGIVPGVLLFDLVWGSSFVEAEAIFYSSSLLRGLKSGRLTERCYSRFMRQEELYLSRVKITLEVLIGGLREDGKIRSLLLDVFRQYSTRQQSLQPSPPPPKWLQWSLQSFHRLVLEEPVYWLVALSARACLQNFVVQRLHQELGAQPPTFGNRFYQMWRRENAMFVWVTRFREVMEEHQGRMDRYKAVHIFREHMMNQKSLHKAVNCEDDEDEETHGRADVL